MYIKNIIISGFRSYKDLSFKEELSPKHNIIVGKNGSGKSNFFAAVQFVLSEKFSELRSNERKDLFHVGSGRPALSVFVEIVFDNSDGRIVIPGRPEEQEVRIRRTLGLKQDEFRVNDRKFSAAEVRQLLISAGFSSSNPYYIVEQGKIVNLANMSEFERYQLLKDVAGTKVYEARREESEKILEDTSVKLQRVDESIGQLDSRLKELEAESSELAAFQQADKDRKALEYCIYAAELASVKQMLERAEASWKAQDISNSDDDRVRADIDTAVATIKDIEQKIAVLERERDNCEKERASMTSKRSIMNLNVSDAAADLERQSVQQRALEKEKKELTTALQKSNTDLQAKQKALTKLEADVQGTNKSVSTMETRLEVLQAKRGRNTQFKSKGERDVWLKEEVKRNDTLVAENEAKIKELGVEATNLQKSLKQEQTKASKIEETFRENEKSTDSHAKTREQHLAKRDKLNSERRSLWQKIDAQETVVARQQDVHQRLISKLERTVRNDIRQGHNSLQETLREINDPALTRAVHGQVIDLIDVQAEYRTAVEITAGNALFNVVVDSFDVSARLLDHMNRKKKPGRVTFFPMDTMKAKPREIKASESHSLLLSHVKHQSKFSGVLAELFGKTVVTKAIDSGAALCRELDCDVVTLDGDQFNRKGGISGGYVDKSATKITLYHDVRVAATAVKEAKEKLSGMCQAVGAVEQKITAVIQEIEQLNSQDANSRTSADSEMISMRFAEERISHIQQQLQRIDVSIGNLKSSNEAITMTNSALREELKSEFKTTLTSQEESELEKLQVDVQPLRASLTSLLAKRSAALTDRQLLQDTIGHMERRLASVVDRIHVLSRGDKSSMHGAMAKEIAALDEDLKVLAKRISAAESGIEELAVKRRVEEDRLDQLRRTLLEAEESKQQSREKIDMAHNQRALLIQKKEDAQSKIRRLGVIPTDVDRFSSMSTSKLMQLLKKANDELKKYAHVNKKALDQHNGLVEARGDLKTKRDELKEELQSIQKLMEHLDNQKDEAIMRTYKQVQYQFEEVFKDLVAAEGCAADLQLVRAPKGSPDPFTEVRVKVSFGLGAPTAELTQLSGGQKSLVALALIFAIQRCDPAPFYLFDEIDAALDAEYRTNVARMLQNQSESCQFITATFKTEMLESADRVYGIFFHNKVSRIDAITKDEGRALLHQAAIEERKRRREEDEGDVEVA